MKTKVVLCLIGILAGVPAWRAAEVSAPVQLNWLDGQAPAAPAELVQAYPRLRERVHVVGQQDMFL